MNQLLFLSLVIIISFAFGPGYQHVSLAPIIALATFKYLMRAKNHSNFLIVILSFSSSFIGYFIAYAGSFEASHQPSLTSPATQAMVPVALQFSFVITLIGLIDRLVVSYLRPSPVVDTFFGFPAIWTAVWAIMYRISIFGDFGSWHTSLHIMEVDSLTRGAVFLFGAFSGGTYVIALLAGVFLDSLNVLKSLHNDVDVVDRGKLSGAVKGGSFLVGLIAFGSLIPLFDGSFYQIPVSTYAPKTIPVACMTNPSVQQIDSYLTLNKAKILITSEESLTTRNETELLDRFKSLSQKHDTILGIGYAFQTRRADSNTKYLRNMFSLILPPSVTGKNTSSIAFKYQKSHPVPGVESEVEPGNGKVLIADTPYGKIGAAICFDFNFPFINQIAHQNVSIMLQPSATWGPVAIYHARTNRLRTIEHGFTLFRCASKGVSGVYDYANKVHAETLTVKRGDTMEARLPLLGRRQTVYSYTGDILGALSVSSLIYWISQLATIRLGPLNNFFLAAKH